MAGNYKIKIEPILNTASLNKQLNETKKLKLSTAGQSAGGSFMSGFGRAVKERMKYSVANFLIYGTQNAIKDMVANVRELDKAQTELKKVSDLTGKSLDKFTEQAYETGNKVAKTGTQIVQAATEFKKSGFNESDSLILSKVASMYQNVADVELDAGEAASFIISQMKAFNLEAKDAEHIIDAVNEVSNKYAVSSADIATNIGKASATLAEGNVTYEQSIGLLTAMTEITRSGSKAARGLVTIQSRYNQIIDESSSTGKKLSAWYKEHNIEIKDQNGQLRSFYDVASDVADIWDTLDKNERLYYRNIQAGATQSQNLASLMRNFGTAAGATATAIKSAGSAARENEKYLDSIEGKLNAFQSAWEQLSYHVINSDFLKDVIDLGTDLIKVLDTLVQKIGVLPTLIGLVGTAFGTWKLAEYIPQLLGFASATEKVAKGVSEAGKAASTASGAKGLGSLKNIIGFLTNPAVLGGIAALGVAIAAIKFDEYFNFDNSLKRLEEYQDKLVEVSDEIEALRKKRDSDEGLTNAEKTHLAVLEAEERALERQIRLEKQRVQNAFKKDISTKQGKKYQERTGPTELLDYQDSRKKEADLNKQIEQQKELLKNAERTAQYYRMMGDKEGAKQWDAQANAYQKRLDGLYDKYVKLDAEAAEAASNLAQYWEEVSANVDYESLGEEEKVKFDEIHKAFLESQIDASNLKDSYEDVSNVLTSAMDSLGHDNLNLFDDIDISSITTAEEAIEAIKKQLKGLDEDTEITFSVKDKNGEVKQRIKKVSELTDKDIEAIVHFSSTGGEEVESEKEELSEDEDATVHLSEEGSAAVESIIDGIVNTNYLATVNVDEKGASKVQSTINNIKGKDVIVNVIKKISEIFMAKGKRKGEAGGVAWLGDEGTRANPKPELVVGENGAYLAGTQGWELYPVKDSDTVYSYADTKKLLGGKQTFAQFNGEIPRYKKGKVSKKKKQKRKEFNKKLKRLEHNRKIYHWTDEKYQEEYKKLFLKYRKWLSQSQRWERFESREEYEHDVDLNQLQEDAENILTAEDFAQFQENVNNSKNLSADEKRELIQEAGNKYAKTGYDRTLGVLSARGAEGGLESFLSDVRSSEYLSKAEKAQYAKEAYETVAEYNLKAYKNGVKTREDALKSIEDYYREVGEYDENYYKMLDELREADKEKEIDRLNELKEEQDNRLSLAQKYLQRELNTINKEIDAQKEESDQLEKLTDLEKELTQAKSKKIRVYREGIGFVYEADTEAIKKAEKALSDYKGTLEKSDLEKRADEIQAILDLFDELADDSAIKELELLLGVGSLAELTGGDFGTNLAAWASWITKAIGNSAGYAELINILDKLDTSQIGEWLNANGDTQIDSARILEYLNKHSFASGTLSAPAGLAQVAEHLKGELVWLGKGDSVYSNAVSRNLMEWGQYSPAEIIKAHDGSTMQVFNFDQIVLPNVYNAEDFYRELQNLPNKTLQQFTYRI